MGFVQSIVIIKTRLEDLENMCMFLGYAQNLTGATYRMLNMRTKCIVLSHEVIYLNKTYREYVSIK